MLAAVKNRPLAPARRLIRRKFMLRHPRAILSFTTLLLVTIALTLTLASCGPEPYDQQDERVVLVSRNISLPYWQEAEAGMQDAAKALGVKAEFAGPDSFAPDQELDAFQKA